MVVELGSISNACIMSYDSSCGACGFGCAGGMQTGVLLIRVLCCWLCT